MLHTSRFNMIGSYLRSHCRIWLYDVAQCLPAGSQLDGFDISSSQFPDPATIPKNMTFREQDLLQPFPEEFLGKYDVVHIRLMCFALNGDEWGQAVKRLVALLSMCLHRSF